MNLNYNIKSEEEEKVDVLSLLIYEGIIGEYFEETLKFEVEILIQNQVQDFLLDQRASSILNHLMGCLMEDELSVRGVCEEGVGELEEEGIMGVMLGETIEEESFNIVNSSLSTLQVRENQPNQLILPSSLNGRRSMKRR